MNYMEVNEMDWNSAVVSTLLIGKRIQIRIIQLLHFCINTRKKAVFIITVTFWSLKHPVIGRRTGGGKSPLGVRCVISIDRIRGKSLCEGEVPQGFRIHQDAVTTTFFDVVVVAILIVILIVIERMLPR